MEEINLIYSECTTVFSPLFPKSRFCSDFISINISKNRGENNLSCIQPKSVYCWKNFTTTIPPFHFIIEIKSSREDGFFLQPPTERTLWAANLRPRAGCTLSVSLSLCLMFYRFIFWTLLFSFLPTRSYSSKAFVIKHPATTLRCQIHRLFLNCNLY